MQFVPFGIGGVPGKGCPWVEACVEDVSGLRLQAYLIRGENDPFVIVKEMRDDMLGAELQLDASVLE